MSDTHTQVAEVTDDLDAFSAEFFGQGTKQNDEAPPTTEPEVKPDEPDEPLDPVEDAPTPETDTSDPEDDDEPEAEKPKGKQSAQERIRELTAARREAEREAAALREEFEKLKALVEGKDKPTAQPEPAPAPSTDGPSPDDLNEDGSEKYPLGEYDPRYIRDLTKYTIKVEREAEDKEKAEAAKAEEAKAAQEALTEEWSEKLTKAQESYPDLRERLNTLDETFADVEPAYGEFLAATVMSMDFGPDVLYYLANNLDEAQKIVKSGPTKAVIALGRLEARFADTEAVKKPKLSAAPTPPPTNRGSAPAVGVAPDTDDLDAFAAMYFKRK